MFATFFNDKLDLLYSGELNEVDRKKLFRDVRSIFMAYSKKLKDFYKMQDHLANIIGERNPES